jgi:hypothetical protein
MRENLAKEKLRIVDIIKENATTALVIGGFVWTLYATVILPIKNLEYQVGDIINNHIKTIQDESVTATAERKAQSEKLDKLSGEIIKLTTILEQITDKKLTN